MQRAHITILVLAVSVVCSGWAGAADGVAFTPYDKKSYTPNFKKAKEAKLEKTKIKLGMIKLTDCIPIVAAKELGYFADEGLSVEVEVQPNWKAVNDRVISEELDGSHMLYNHPIGAAIGYGVQADLICPYAMSINGMGLTVSNALWQEAAAIDERLKAPGYAMPIGAEVLKKIAGNRKVAGKDPLKFFMTFPSGSHNMNIRYWLAAGGINPGFYEGYNDSLGTKGAELLLQVNPPPQMAQAMAGGNCDGFCVGEPWNMQVTVADKTGRPMCPSQYVFRGSPDKIFACSRDWADTNPNTLNAVVKALIRAGYWLDEGFPADKSHRKLAAEMLAHKDYIGAKVEILAESMLGTYVYGFDGDQPDRRDEPDFNVFFRSDASFPLRSTAVWALTQARRWGQIPENKSDGWYHDIAEKTFRPDIYRKAFAILQQEGRIPADLKLPESDYKSYPAECFIDHIAFDPAHPNDYLKQFAIGLK